MAPRLYTASALCNMLKLKENRNPLEQEAMIDIIKSIQRGFLHPSEEIYYDDELMMMCDYDSDSGSVDLNEPEDQDVKFTGMKFSAKVGDSSILFPCMAVDGYNIGEQPCDREPDKGYIIPRLAKIGDIDFPSKEDLMDMGSKESEAYCALRVSAMKVTNSAIMYYNATPMHSRPTSSTVLNYLMCELSKAYDKKNSNYTCQYPHLEDMVYATLSVEAISFLEDWTLKYISGKVDEHKRFKFAIRKVLPNMYKYVNDYYTKLYAPDLKRTRSGTGYGDSNKRRK